MTTSRRFQSFSTCILFRENTNSIVLLPFGAAERVSTLEKLSMPTPRALSTGPPGQNIEQFVSHNKKTPEEGNFIRKNFYLKRDIQQKMALPLSDRKLLLLPPPINRICWTKIQGSVSRETQISERKGGFAGKNEVKTLSICSSKNSREKINSEMNSAVLKESVSAWSQGKRLGEVKQPEGCSMLIVKVFNKMIATTATSNPRCMTMR